MRTSFVTAVLLALVATSAAAQDIRGMLDFDKSVEEQIKRLERRVGGDQDAFKQVVVYQWLIQLYDSIDRLDDIENSYERILAFYPNDVGTRNAYARFLMDRRNDNARAEGMIRKAVKWARGNDIRSLDLPTTYALWAELRYRSGRYDTAVEMANLALELRGGSAPGEALRTLARSHGKLGQYDEATAAWLRLIAVGAGANKEDINDLKLLLAESGRTIDVNSAIEQALADESRRRHDDIEFEGAKVVLLESSDGLPLEGTLRRSPEDVGAILFIHDFGAVRTAFSPFDQMLSLENFTTFTVDLRGHGASRNDTLGSFADLPPRHVERIADDIAAAYRYLADTLDIPAVAIVAEGAACAAVEKALYRSQIAAPVAYLSPSFDPEDRDLRTALAFRIGHPTLVLYATEDIDAMHSVSIFESMKRIEGLESQMFDHAGHGSEVLRREPRAVDKLLRWATRVLETP